MQHNNLEADFQVFCSEGYNKFKMCGEGVVKGVLYLLSVVGFLT